MVNHPILKKVLLMIKHSDLIKYIRISDYRSLCANMNYVGQLLEYIHIPDNVSNADILRYIIYTDIGVSWRFNCINLSYKLLADFLRLHDDLSKRKDIPSGFLLSDLSRIDVCINDTDKLEQIYNDIDRMVLDFISRNSCLTNVDIVKKESDRIIRTIHDKYVVEVVSDDQVGKSIAPSVISTLVNYKVRSTGLRAFVKEGNDINNAIKLPSVLKHKAFEFLNFVPDDSHYAFRQDIEIDPLQQDFIFSNTALYVVSKKAAEFVVQHIEEFKKIDLWFFDSYYNDIIKLGA